MKIADQDIQKAAAKKVEVDRERLRRAWARDGYRPRAHLDDMIGEGEIGLLLTWGSYSGMFIDSPYSTREQKLPAVLARWDIAEIASIIQRARATHG